MVTLKKQVSMRKFSRIRSNSKSKLCHTYRYRNDRWLAEMSLEAYKYGDYVYAIYPDATQSGHRLKCHCVRYWVGDHERADLFSFVYTIDARF